MQYKEQFWAQWSNICGVIGCAPVSAIYNKWMS